MQIGAPRERRRSTQAKELLEFGEMEDPAFEVEKMIEESRPEVIHWAKTHKGNFSYMEFGRQTVELFPDLQSEFGLRPEDWPEYKDQLEKIRFSAGNDDYIVGAVQWFPERRTEIQTDFSHAISRIGLGIRTPGTQKFLSAHRLAIVRPDSKHLMTLKENLEPALNKIFYDDNPIYSRVVDAAKILIHFPERKAEIQAFFIAHFAEIRTWVANVKKDQSTHDLPGFLHGLKIIFADKVVADEFGRLTFETKGKAVQGSKPLPERLEG